VRAQPTNNFNPSHQLLDERKPIVPNSEAPDIETLLGRVAALRRYRRRKRWLLGGIGTVCFLAVVGRAIRPNQPTATTPSSSIAQPISPSGTQHRDSPAAASQDPNIRAFVRVRQSVPLFGRYEQTNTFQHIGWTSSERMVPMDVSRFSEEQQATIEAVLSDAPAATRFNL
jgi:hypothetical protein